MSPDRLKELIKFMEEHGLVELEIEEEGRRVRMRKGPEGAPVIVPLAPAPAPAELRREAAAPSPGREDLIEITSPMVGTFYRAPQPDAKPFVDVGDPVGPEDVVCIIEAMKVFNEVPARVSGTIHEICVENAEQVEYGQVLFRLQP